MFRIPAVRSLVAILALASCGVAVATPTEKPHRIFLNHSFIVLDAGTADAIEHSDYLKSFGAFEVRTTTANGGDTWKGRYLAGKQTYLEFFGPDDLREPGVVPGDSGLAIIKAGLAREGIAHPDTARRTRLYGKDSVDWFDLVSVPGEPQALSAWAMEYVPGFFDDKRSGKEPAEYPGDISRERYQPDTYREKLMRDVSALEIACPAGDIALILPLLKAAGFTIHKGKGRVEASDGSTTVTLDAVPLPRIGWRKVVFVLNAPARDAHIEHIGRSTLVVGPGRHATWTFPSP